MAVSNVTTVNKPFYQSGEGSMFSVIEGVSMERALNEVSCLLDVARSSAHCADDEPNMIHSAAFHIQAAKAVVDSILSGIIKQRNTDKASEVNHG